MKGFFTFVSYIFHPVFVTLWILGLLVLIDPVLNIYFNGSTGLRILTIIVLLMVVMPIIAIKMMQQYGVIASVEVKDMKDRLPAYIFSLLFYGICFNLLIRLGAPIQLLQPLLASMTVLLVLLIFSRIIKISAHLAAMSSVVAILFFYMKYYDGILFYLLISILICGIVASARLYLNAHTNKEIWFGLLTGVASTMFIMNNIWVLDLLR